jgi:hypothetical protein
LGEEETNQVALADGMRAEKEALQTERARLKQLAGQLGTGLSGVAAQGVAMALGKVVEEKIAECGNAIDAIEAQAEAKRQKQLEQIQKGTELGKQRSGLDPLKMIREIDVGLDQVLTALKLTCMQLMVFAQRRYLTTMKMNAETFVARVMPLQGRREERPGEERVIFYENPRDPAVTEGVRAACANLNASGLKRRGRVVRYAMESGPT